MTRWRADVARITVNEPTRLMAVAAVATHLGLHAVLAYRVAHWLARHRLTVPAMMLGYASSVWTGSQISRHAMIGHGFAVLHPHGVVIGPSVVIGRNVTLAGRNTIGQRMWNQQRPVICTGVTIGVGAVVLGRVYVGYGATVGANAVVVDDVAERRTVVGSPARVSRAHYPVPA